MRAQRNNQFPNRGLRAADFQGVIFRIYCLQPTFNIPLPFFKLTIQMSNTIHCIKLDREEAQLDAPPFPGKLGERVYANVSKKAWAMWLSQQTILINEYRLSLIDPKSREFLLSEMEKYFFSDAEQK